MFKSCPMSSGILMSCDFTGTLPYCTYLSLDFLRSPVAGDGHSRAKFLKYFTVMNGTNFVVEGINQKGTYSAELLHFLSLSFQGRHPRQSSFKLNSPNVVNVALTFLATPNWKGFFIYSPRPSTDPFGIPCFFVGNLTASSSSQGLLYWRDAKAR